MAKMAASMVEHGEDAFRKLFKFYKRRHPPPDFSDVIDFSKGPLSEKMVSAKLDNATVSDCEAMSVGLQPASNWKAFSLLGYPGFIFITNPFLQGSQPFWVRQCLKTYPQKPNVCNLDMHMSTTETDDIWSKSADILRVPQGKRQPKTLLEKLRWVTLGYHYNWDTKTYSANHYTPFPADLHSLSRHVAAACGFPGFNAEAGILNYYRSDSSLGIHVDESELDHTRPLLSFSFGQSAIFLLGGTRREDPPTAMYMHSGDIMVMSGSSRLLYHAVPRIMPTLKDDLLGVASETQGLGTGHGLIQNSSRCEPGTLLQEVCTEDWEVCSSYMQSSRVNMTVRQVLGLGQTFPAVHNHSLTDVSQTEGYHEESLHGEKGCLKKRRRSDEA